MATGLARTPLLESGSISSAVDGRLKGLGPRGHLYTLLKQQFADIRRVSEGVATLRRGQAGRALLGHLW